MKTQTSKIRTLLAGAALVALVAIPLARADYPSTVTSQSPVGYWRLSETTPSPAPITTAANLGSSAAGSGTYNGSSGYFRGLPGALSDSTTSAHMDGAAQYISVPYNADMNPAANFTIEAWLKADGASGQCPLSCAHATSPRSGWFFYQVSGTGYEFRMYNTNGNAFSVDVIGNAGNVVGVWTHVVATFDGTTAKLYLNGVLAGSGILTGSPNYVPGTDGQFRIGQRSDGGFPWAGGADEVAFYPSILTDVEIATHYGAASTNAAGYAGLVTGKSPLLYLRLNEAGNTPTVNLGTLGAAGNGEFTSGSLPGQVGPRPAAYPGFDALNYSVGFNGSGGSVAVPALNLNTNTVTISAWVKPNGSQALAAGLVVCNAGGTYAGLIMDPAYGGLGLGYQWGSTANNVSFSSDLLLPQLVDSQWSYVALVIQPSEAAIYLCDNVGNWSSATNTFSVNNANQPFSAATLFGMDAGFANRNFNGNVDEVAIFKRALGAGELYTQYAAAVGGVQPRIFADLQGPLSDVAAGDPIVLTVDAGGTPNLTFTWHKAGVGTIATTTNGVLTIASAVLGDTGTYDVTISNGIGSDANSQTVAVTVVTPSTSVITGIAGYKNRTLYLGATLRLEVVGTGGGLKYQWYKDAAPIPSATASVYSVGVTNTSQAGSFSVSVTNSVGATTSGPPAVITIPNMASNSYEGVLIAAGPEAWWRLDETSGTNMFDGMGRHDGNYTNAAGGGTLPTLGVVGALIGDTNTAATFVSAGQGIGLVPYSPTLNPGKFSVEAWVKTSVLDGQSPFSSSRLSTGWTTESVDGWWHGRGSGGIFGNNVVDGAHVNPNGAILPGYWSHVVVLYDNTVQSGGTFYPFRLYVNGQTDGYIWGGDPVNSGGPFIIGGRGGVTAGTFVDQFFDGQVDEVAVYSRVLSAAEITNHFTARGTVIVAASFTSPLLSQTVTTGKSISFSTTVQGTGPIGLYWYKGTPQATAPIATGTNALWINPTALTDTATYSIVASNVLGTVTNTASLTVISPVGYANITNNLVLHLTFDTDTTDSSGRGNHGTPSSPTAPAFVPGVIGPQALEYTTTTNGLIPVAVSSASYVALGTAGSGPPTDLRFGAATSFTVGLWVKLGVGSLIPDLPFIGTATNSANNPGWVLCPSYKLGGWQWDLNDGANNINVGGPDGSINNGAWHNFVLAVDRAGGVANSYLDGVLVASRNIAALGSIDNNNYWPIVIGQDPTTLYAEAGSATLDDIGIWRRALTPLEVAQIDSAGATGGRSFDTVAPVLPTLTISRSGADVVLTYTGGTLVESTDPTVTKDAWTPVGGASSPWTVTPGGVNKFYSVRQ